MAYEMIQLQEIEDYVVENTPQKMENTTWFEINLPSGSNNNAGTQTPAKNEAEEKAKMKRTLYIMGGIFAAIMILIVVLSMRK